MKLARTISFLVLLLALSAKAQDIHFSQFDSAPFNVNPGNTGNFEGRHRFQFNQRSQWRSVTTPYLTTGIAYDVRLPGDALLKKRRQECPPLYRKWNVGVVYFGDRAGDSRLSQHQLSVLVSRGGRPLAGGFSITPGLALGITNMSIDYTKLQFDTQWNGLAYNAALPNGESFARDARTYVHLHAGVVTCKKWSDRRWVDGGISVYNVSSPRQSWFDQSFVRLDRRVNIHVRASWEVQPRWQIEPTMLWMAQGTYREWNVGARVHYLLSDQPWMYRSVFAGIMGRARDAGYFSAGVRYDDWTVAVSYDVNTSALRTVSNGRGGLEWSVAYIIAPKPRICLTKKVCPDYF